MLTRLRLMSEYESWANRLALESIRQLSEPEECLRLFGHIFAAQRIWLARLRTGDSSQVEIFPSRTAAECEAEMCEVEKDMAAYLATLDDEKLEAETEYIHQQSGEIFRNTPHDILTHAGTHSHYHRGQIALLVRQAGGQPASTDFIVFQRLSR